MKKVVNKEGETTKNEGNPITKQKDEERMEKDNRWGQKKRETKCELVVEHDGEKKISKH